MAKIRNLVGPLFWGFATYSLFIFLLGSTGVKAVSDLNRAKRRLTEHLVILRKKQEVLKRHFRSFQQDPEAIEGRAWRLGYFREGAFVLLPSWERSESREENVGRILPHHKPSSTRDDLFRMIGVFVAGVLMVMGVIRPRWREETRRGDGYLALRS